MKTVELIFVGDDDSAIKTFTHHFDKYKVLFGYKITNHTGKRLTSANDPRGSTKATKKADYTLFVADTAHPDRYYKDVLPMFKSNGMFKDLLSTPCDGQILLNASGKLVSDILGDKLIDTGDSFVSEVITAKDVFNREYEVYMDTMAIQPQSKRSSWANANSMIYAYSKYIRSIDNSEIIKHKRVPANYREVVVNNSYGNRLYCNLDLSRQVRGTQHNIMDIIVDFIYRRINIK